MNECIGVVCVEEEKEGMDKVDGEEKRNFVQNKQNGERRLIFCIQRFDSARFVTPALDKVAVRPVLRKKSMYGVSARLFFRACCIPSKED